MACLLSLPAGTAPPANVLAIDAMHLLFAGNAMILLTDHPEGVLLPVRAQPGAGGNGLRGEQNGALKVAVTQVAEKGKANLAVVEVLAKGLGLRRSQLELTSGPAQRDKVFLVRGIARHELAARIAAAIGG